MTQVVRFRDPTNDELRLGLVEGESVTDAGPAPAGGFVPSIEAWQRLEPREHRHVLADLTLLPPLDPAELLCIGLNYGEHARESGKTPPPEPLIFAKLRSAVASPGETIVVPAQEPQPDWEAELAIVLGREARNVGKPDALQYVGGYTGLNDV